MLQNNCCILNWSCEVGLFCLFSNPGPFFVCSYPHDKVNRLSCDKARNYYSGVVSLILLALELLQRMVSSYTYCGQDNTSAGDPNVDVLESSGQRGGTAGVGDVSFSLTGHATCAHNTKKTQAKRTGAWHAIKPAWRPPSLTTRIRPFPLFDINQHCNKVCFSWFDLWSTITQNLATILHNVSYNRQTGQIVFNTICIETQVISIKTMQWHF